MSGNPGKKTDQKTMDRIVQLLKSGVASTIVAKRLGVSNSLVRMIAAKLPKSKPTQGESNDEDSPA